METLNIEDISKLRDFIAFSLLREAINEHLKFRPGDEFSKCLKNVVHVVSVGGPECSEFDRHIAKKIREVTVFGLIEIMTRSNSGQEGKPIESIAKYSSSNTRIYIEGDLSQAIAKAYNAAGNSNRATSLALGGMGAGSAAILSYTLPAAFAAAAPTGGLSLVVGGLIGVATGYFAGRFSEDAYNAVPYVREARFLRALGFNRIENNLTNIYLTRA